ncbi:MAG: TRAP transporter small permease [Planctomycetota bacterium]|jgi:TRAP-type C4-dicarboxylate transport system permease small subunit|nr:TRAP transporter small permease [Planctomycetota bacterium]
MLKKLKSVNDIVAKIMNWLMIFFMSGMVVFIFMQVIYRYILKTPLSWSEELSRYFFSGVTLFGAVVLFKESKHINMSLLTDRIKSECVRKLFYLACQAFCLVFLLAIIWYGFPMAYMIVEFEVMSPSMEWLKMGYVFMMLPVASLLSISMLLELILSTAKTLKTGEAK